MTSTELESKLLNVARASIRELKEDYLDYIRSHGVSLWNESYPRYSPMLTFCQKHNKIEDYVECRFSILSILSSVGGS